MKTGGRPRSSATRSLGRFMRTTVVVKLVAMNSSNGSTKPPTASNPLIGILDKRGWARTKRNYVRLMFKSDMPESFPLNAELASLVPDSLEGPMPQSDMDVWGGPPDLLPKT